MLSKKVEEILNRQINAELASAYIYLSMAAWFESENLAGSAKWMRRQAREETAHAMKIFDYICDQDSRVTLTAVKAPPTTFKDWNEVWQGALEHEEKVTAMINECYEVAVKEKDRATQVMLDWFVTEQVEEERTARSIRDQAAMIKHSTAMFFLDRHLGKDAEKTDD
jgi:ferritin